MDLIETTEMMTAELAELDRRNHADLLAFVNRWCMVEHLNHAEAAALSVYELNNEISIFTGITLDHMLDAYNSAF